MWLARSLPPLLSHLRRPASARHRSLLLGGSSSRAYTSSEDESFNRDPAHGSTASSAGSWPSSSKRPDFCSGCGSNQLLQQRGHLYLALDNWKHGFSIHKLSLDDLLGGGGGGCDLQRLPEPLLRLRFLTVGSYPRFHAVGSSIVVTSYFDRFGDKTTAHDGDEDGSQTTDGDGEDTTDTCGYGDKDGAQTTDGDGENTTDTSGYGDKDGAQTTDGDGVEDGETTHNNGDGGDLTLVYDTETAAMDMVNSLPRELSISNDDNYPAMAAGGNLYTFDSRSDNGLPYLCWIESNISQYDGHDEEEPYCTMPQRRWIWESSPTPPPFHHAKHEHSFVSATALHPDGRTVFVSVRCSWKENEQIERRKKEVPEYLKRKPDEEEERRQKMRLGTFSLDTVTGEWTRHGDWHLPFKGEALYDGSLDAWVGTRMVQDDRDYCYYEHLCTCDVPAIVVGELGTPAPEWKVGQEKLTFLEGPLQTMGVRCDLLVGFRLRKPRLLRTGGGMFCLVETARREGTSFRRMLGGGDRWQLRVTMFRPKYGKNGELVAAPVLPGRSYRVSRYLSNFHASAFWI